MKRSLPIIISILALVAALLAGSGNALARPRQQGGAPAVVSYQGQVAVNGQPYSGTGYFKFAVVDAGGATSYWSNDGTSTAGSEPTAAVSLPVANGLFTVLLGDTSLAGMTQPLAATVFGGPEHYLRVWFSADGVTYTQLTPDRRIAAVPYALQAEQAANADTLDGKHAADLTYTAGAGLTLSGNQFNADTTYLQRRVASNCTVGSSIRAINADGTVVCEPDDNTTYTAGAGLELSGNQFRIKGSGYQNVRIVAKSGGDFTSIQAALDSITNASETNRYLVWVAPGVYNEHVKMIPYVDIEGSGELTTKITYGGSSSMERGTVEGANSAELRFLTVENTGGASFAVAIYNYSASPRLIHLTIYASGGSAATIGVYNNQNCSPYMTNLNIFAQGGTGSGNLCYGVLNLASSTPTMKDLTVSATGSPGTFRNVAIWNAGNSPVGLTNVLATATNGTYVYGVYSGDSSLYVSNSNIKAIGGSQENIGIYLLGGSGDYASYDAIVSNSQIYGATNTVYGDTEFRIQIRLSTLTGGPVVLPDPLAVRPNCSGVVDGDIPAFFVPGPFCP